MVQYVQPWNFAVAQANFKSGLRHRIWGTLGKLPNFCETEHLLGIVVWAKRDNRWSIEQSACHHEHSGSGGHTYQLAVASNRNAVLWFGKCRSLSEISSSVRICKLCILPSSLSHFSLFPGYLRFPPPQRLPSCVRWLACLSLVVLGVLDDSDSYLLVTIMQYLVHNRYPNIGGVNDLKKKRNVQNTVPLLF